MFKQQPMKMAAAEAACHTGTGFSVLSFGDLGSTSCKNVVTVIEIPGLLSWLANGNVTTAVKGVDQLVPQYQQEYGKTIPNNSIYGAAAGTKVNYVPIMAVTYWGFRLMILFGSLAAFAAAVALWLTRKGTVPSSKWLMRLASLRHPRPVRRQRMRVDLHRNGAAAVRRRPQPDAGWGRRGVHVHRRRRLPGRFRQGRCCSHSSHSPSSTPALMVVEISLLVKFVRGGVVSAMPELGENPHDDDPTGPKRDDVLSFAY